MSDSTKIALITLVQSNGEVKSADDLAKEIRRELESSTLSESWVVDKVTILEEPTATQTRIMPTEDMH